MDAKLQTLLHAYGEPIPTGVPPQPLDAEEAAVLAATRAWLDARPKNAPDAAVLDLIFRAAAHGAPAPAQPGLRHDRVPARHARLHRRGWAMVGLACSLALGGFAFSLSLSARVAAPTTVTAPPPGAARMLAAAPTAPVQDREVTPPAPAPVAAVTLPVVAKPAAPKAAATPPVAAKRAPAPEKVWTADDGDVRLDAARAKTERLRTRLDAGLWDAPAVTLTLPTPGPQGRFSAVSAGQ